MSLYLISYDLNSLFKDYNALYEAIESIGPSCHCLESTWLVYTNTSAQDICTAISLRIGVNLSLLVIKVSKDFQTWLPAESRNFIVKYLS